MPEGQGVGRRRNRTKPTSGATRHLLPEEGGRSGMSSHPPLPMEGGSPKGGGWPKAKRAKPTSGATRHLLPEEGGRSGMSNLSTPFPWKGDARRAGVGRREKRAKPTSGAMRHLLPEEGGRSGMSNLSTSFQRKEGKIIFPVVEKEQNQSCHPIV